ncbi:MAG: outer membrane lipoprotein carrier protein LolA [Elusimicrobiota bacterium]
MRRPVPPGTIPLCCALAVLLLARAPAVAASAAEESATPAPPETGGAVAVPVSTSASASDSAGAFVYVPSSTGPLTVEDVLAHFETFDRELKTLTAVFTQSLTMTETGMTSSIEGSVAYGKPSRLRIEHVRPERQTVVSDGKDIWIHRHSRSQVIQSDIEDWKKADPTLNNLMQFGNYAKMLRTYDVSIDTTGAQPILRLVPKKRDPAQDLELRLALEPETLFPERTELAVGAIRARTNLSRVVFNPPLAEETFRFSPPPGVDVFRDFKPPRFEP